MSDESVKPPAPLTPWDSLRRHTPARIGLERSGASLATGPLLSARLAQARARDAVHEPLDETRLGDELGVLGLPVVVVSSGAENRQQYLLRPDLGRRLAPGAETLLTPHAQGDIDVVFVITDGLSARATQSHAAPLLAAWELGLVVEDEENMRSASRKRLILRIAPLLACLPRYPSQPRKMLPSLTVSCSRTRERKRQKKAP